MFIDFSTDELIISVLLSLQWEDFVNKTQNVYNNCVMDATSKYEQITYVNNKYFKLAVYLQRNVNTNYVATLFI